MKTIRYTNESGDMAVEFLVDLVDDNSDFLTVYDTKGLDDEDIAFGVNFNDLDTTSLTAMKAFAVTNNLTCQIYEDGETTVTSNTYTALAVTTTTLPDGVAAGEAQVETITIPATSAAAQGDYVVLSNYKGETLAAWLDIDGAGTEPTGVKYTGADYTAKVSIVTGGTAAANGTLFAHAISVAPDWPQAVTIIDGEDGTVEITQNLAGDCDDADPENIGSTGAGSITISVDTDGSGTAYTETTAASDGGNAPITWSATGLPAGLSIDPVTGVISGVPTAAAGDSTVVLTATDFYDVTDDSVEITLTLAE